MNFCGFYRMDSGVYRLSKVTTVTVTRSFDELEAFDEHNNHILCLVIYINVFWLYRLYRLMFSVCSFYF